MKITKTNTVLRFVDRIHDLNSNIMQLKQKIDTETARLHTSYIELPSRLNYSDETLSQCTNDSFNFVSTLTTVYT